MGGAWQAADFPALSKDELLPYSMTPHDYERLQKAWIGTQVEPQRFSDEELRRLGHASWKSYLIEGALSHY